MPADIECHGPHDFWAKVPLIGEEYLQTALAEVAVKAVLRQPHTFKYPAGQRLLWVQLHTEEAQPATGEAPWWKVVVIDPETRLRKPPKR